LHVLAMLHDVARLVKLVAREQQPAARVNAGAAAFGEGSRRSRAGVI